MNQYDQNNQEKKKSSPIVTLLKLIVTVIGGILLGNGAHKTREASQRNDAMDAAMKENNK